MKTKFLLLVTLAGALVSAPAWAVTDMKLVIEPGIPDSNDVIKISVTNSACYNYAQVVPVGAVNALKAFVITLSYSVQNVDQCLEDNPNAPNFETTIGPLAPGKYTASVSVNTGGRSSHLFDKKSFTVIEASPSASLAEGGITGLYFNPAADGSYISVLETNYNTLVIWNTFDDDGNQLWVYGVGDLLNNGSTVVADTYINRSVGFLPNGEVDAEAEPWGQLRLDLTSCTEGTFTYHSDLPEFDSGQFPIVRLAYSKQIGCDDSQ